MADTYLANRASSSQASGGFFFVCTDEETMTQQLKQHLIALPNKFLDRVEAIRPGMPLFVYYSSDRRVHGIFEAVCNGLNLNAQESEKEFHSSKLTQVKMRVREKRPSLDIDQVRSVLDAIHHKEIFDQIPFELSQTEVEKLLYLFYDQFLYSTCTEDHLNILHNEILKFAETERPSHNLYLRVHTAVESLKIQIQMIWPNKGIEVYGSYGTGLCCKNSDIDLVIVDRLQKEELINEEKKSLMRQLAKNLKRCSWCRDLSVIGSAKVPLIKLYWNQKVSNEESIPIDITIGQSGIHNGTFARDHVLEKLCFFPQAISMILLLKTYMRNKNANKVSRGGLTSYSLVLLVIFYIEQYFPMLENVIDSSSVGEHSSIGEPIEPVIERARIVVDYSMNHLQNSSSRNLGTLLLRFLDYFASDVDFATMKIVLKKKDNSCGRLFWRQKEKNLCIEDPMEEGVTIGEGSFGIQSIKDKFAEMLKILTTPLPDTLDPTNPSSRQRSSLPYLDQLLSSAEEKQGKQGKQWKRYN